MPYKCVINTSSYRPHRCSKKNWEPGTTNDFMKAINGWHHTEPNLQTLKWRLLMFQGLSPYSEEEYSSDAYQNWKAQACNKLTYMDSLCGFERTAEICPPGFKQGAGLRVEGIIKALLKDGAITIPFSRVYDARQYDKHMDGCVLTITKIIGHREKEISVCSKPFGQYYFPDEPSKGGDIIAGINIEEHPRKNGQDVFAEVVLRKDGSISVTSREAWGKAKKKVLCQIEIAEQALKLAWDEMRAESATE